jgi:4'-phosphopantetheinyl transferase EntD
MCVGLEAPEGIDPIQDERLHPEERSLALAMAAPRRTSFVLGRIALREAMNRLGLAAAPVLPSADGEPLLPKGVAGSISHKGRIAVAIVAVTDADHVGVDLELLRARGTDLSRHVLSPAERVGAAHLAPADLAREVLIRFSMKEAVYKALYPSVQRYVGFHEVGADPRPDGTIAIHFALRRGEGPFIATGHWRILNDVAVAMPAVLSVVRVRSGLA